jgi:hypothetical protein
MRGKAGNYVDRTLVASTKGGGSVIDHNEGFKKAEAHNYRQWFGEPQTKS